MKRPFLTVAAGAAGSAVLGYSLFMSTQRFFVAQPPYEVLKREGGFELRSYPPRVVAITEVEKSRSPKNEAFRRLAHYIFGGNSRSQKMKMTSPVEMEQGERLKMTFFMPPGSTLEGLPRPEDASVQLERAPARTVAVLRFRGRITDKRVEEHERELLERARGAGWETEGEPFLAQYDGPLAIPFVRRTEVMVRVKR